MAAKLILQCLRELCLVSLTPFSSTVSLCMGTVRKETKLMFHRVIADESWPWPLFLFKAARTLKNLSRVSLRIPPENLLLEKSLQVDLYFLCLENHHFFFRSVLLKHTGPGWRPGSGGAAGLSLDTGPDAQGLGCGARDGKTELSKVPDTKPLVPGCWCKYSHQLPHQPLTPSHYWLLCIPPPCPRALASVPSYVLFPLPGTHFPSHPHHSALILQVSAPMSTSLATSIKSNSHPPCIPQLPYPAWFSCRALRTWVHTQMYHLSPHQE